MRLIQRQRQPDREKAPRVSISQAEITADLIYPATRRPVPAVSGADARRR